MEGLSVRGFIEAFPFKLLFFLLFTGLIFWGGWEIYSHYFQSANQWDGVWTENQWRWAVVFLLYLNYLKDECKCGKK
jgi:hypothetical protein